MAVPGSSGRCINVGFNDKPGSGPFAMIPFFGAPLTWRLLYAVIAGVLWWPMWVGADFFDSGFLAYGSGAVFSGLVLLPYLEPDISSRWIRAAVVLAAGSLSYYTALNLAVFVADEISAVDDTLNLAVAGVIGAAIIGITCQIILAKALSLLGWVVLFGAGVIGGACVAWGLPGGPDLNLWPGHIIWEVLVCWALYFGVSLTEKRRA